MNPIMKNAPHGRANREARMESKTLRGQEILKKRTHNAKVFDLGRGAYQIVQYPDTVHYQDESGAWMEIDNRLDEMKNRSGASVLPAAIGSLSSLQKRRARRRWSPWPLRPGMGWPGNCAVHARA